MKNDIKELDFDAPNAQNDLRYSPDDLTRDEADMEFSYARGKKHKKKFSIHIGGGKKWKKSSKKRGQFWKNLDGSLKKDWFKMKQVGFAPERGAFLLLIKMNVWDLGTKLANLQMAANSGNVVAKTAWDKTLAHWAHFGGDDKILKKNIMEGAGKTPLLVRVNKRVKLIQKSSASGESYSNFVVAGTTIVLSSSIWIPIVALLAGAAGVVGKLAMSPHDQANATAAATDPSNQMDPQEATAAAAQVQDQQATDQVQADVSNDEAAAEATADQDDSSGDSSDTSDDDSDGSSFDGGTTKNDIRIAGILAIGILSGILLTKIKFK